MEVVGRLHSLDNLRAAMMWLGVVLHASAGHHVNVVQSLWNDPQRTLAADVIAGLIHAFRMPVFFVIAGFFVAMLIERRGVAAMIRNRAVRVGLPFLIFWPIVFTATMVLSARFTQPSSTAAASMVEELLLPLRDSARFETLHLWFLDILLGLAIAAAVGARLCAWFPGKLRDLLVQWSRAAAGHWAAAPVLGAALAMIDRNYQLGVLVPSGWFFPPLAEWLHHALFFFFGVVVYHDRERLLALYASRVWICTAAGAVAFCVAAILASWGPYASALGRHTGLWIGLAYSTCAWFWSFALIGGFYRFVGGRNRVLRYLADSSYWVYLVHFPIVIGVAIVLRDWQISAEAKIVINVALTTGVCLMSYQLLARHTVIGVLLNGRRTPLRSSDHAAIGDSR